MLVATMVRLRGCRRRCGYLQAAVVEVVVAKVRLRQRKEEAEEGMVVAEEGMIRATVEGIMGDLVAKRLVERRLKAMVLGLNRLLFRVRFGGVLGL
ncbi:hypothetical protein GW17_00005487 [Ensete ventricosum]|nr:hypothetical protein GW17_00005487 [Ensete ventricosum]